MEAKRYIGIDLHRNCFMACLRLENGREYLKEWKLEDINKFVTKLRASDELAVEVTGNTRLFHEAVAPHVERVVAVNPSQFKVITHSVKKTDPNDARIPFGPAYTRISQRSPTRSRPPSGLCFRSTRPSRSTKVGSSIHRVRPASGFLLVAQSKATRRRGFSYN